MACPQTDQKKKKKNGIRCGVVGGPLEAMEPKNADFQTVEYWDQRYAAEAPNADFDWFRKVGWPWGSQAVQ